jgi:hypothetical protein
VRPYIKEIFSGREGSLGEFFVRAGASYGKTLAPSLRKTIKQPYPLISSLPAATDLLLFLPRQAIID